MQRCRYKNFHCDIFHYIEKLDSGAIDKLWCILTVEFYVSVKNTIEVLKKTMRLSSMSRHRKMRKINLIWERETHCKQYMSVLFSFKKQTVCVCVCNVVCNVVHRLNH